MTENELKCYFSKDQDMWVSLFLMNYEFNKYLSETQWMDIIDSKYTPRSELPTTITNFEYSKSIKLLQKRNINDFKTIKYFLIDDFQPLDLSPLNIINQLLALIIDPVIIEPDTLFDFSGLNKMEYLKVLQLNSSPIINIDFTKFPNIETLDVEAEEFETISSLTHLEKLKCLSLNCKNLNDSSFIENMKQLEFLDISMTSIKRLPNLNDCYYLKEVVPFNTALLKSLDYLVPFRDRRLDIPENDTQFFIIQFIGIFQSGPITLYYNFRTLKDAFYFLVDLLNRKEINGEISIIDWSDIGYVRVNDEYDGKGYYKIKAVDIPLGAAPIFYTKPPEIGDREYTL